jgi:hypothetical protein
MSHPKPRVPRRRGIASPDRDAATAHARHRAPLGPVRGLPTPAEVEEALEREVKDMAARGRPVVGEARERLLEDFKLRYYFGGRPLAYRRTDQGAEVLAVGFKEMSRLFKALSPEERETVVSGFAEPW